MEKAHLLCVNKSALFFVDGARYTHNFSTIQNSFRIVSGPGTRFNQLALSPWHMHHRKSCP